MLVAMARELGVAQLTLDHALDDETMLAAAIERASAADMLVLSGGVSMGRRDLVPAVLSRLGARIVFHRVRQQPGKPLLVALRRDQLVFGLPGTPLGCHLGFHRYVGAAIRKWAGRSTELPRYRGTLGAPLRTASERVLFRLVRVTRQQSHWEIAPLRWLGSSDVIGPAAANAYCRFEPGTHELEAGSELDWEPLHASVLDE
jgi:molybdenum cofactor synthesis domain-containing protein